MKHPMLLVGQENMQAFIRWMVATGIEGAVCNSAWVSLWSEEQYNLALAWLADRDITEFVYPV